VRAGPADLRARAERLRRRMRACDLCPRRCGVDRTAGERGYCGVAAEMPVAAVLAHHGEEPPLSGSRGAGTVFFGGCNLRCDYCQNIQISRLQVPVPACEPAALAARMLDLQRAGCHNIELVTPSHVLPPILEALACAAETGLVLPVVYNSGGYDAVDTLRELEGVVDVYLPDLKYSRADTGLALSDAADYGAIARAAIAEMVRQAGEWRLDEEGCALSGVIVRHLVLPGDLAGTEEVVRFLAALAPPPRLALMAQFHPMAACRHPGLARPLTSEEYDRVRSLVERLGLDGWVQDLRSKDLFRPDFSLSDPFSPDGEARGGDACG